MITALDIDLRKIYAVTDQGQVIAKAQSSVDTVVLGLQDSLDNGDTVLIEVASPVMYIKDPAVVHNVIRWALWNITAAQKISSSLKCKVLVAPSHVWTHGHNLEVRHAVAGCKQKQKDLRECEAMIYYYKQDPSKWIPLPKFLENL